MVRVALITGASRGIGAATALVLAEHGYRVVVNHRASAPQAEEVVATIAAAGGEAMAIITPASKMINNQTVAAAAYCTNGCRK
jgi:NAD(P)-dependent dehydrogenase (short-subunit alcohol dehydrogenase family)